jgi:hypothetical protein
MALIISNKAIVLNKKCKNGEPPNMEGSCKYIKKRFLRADKRQSLTFSAGW